jgi:hypothetical protein
MHDVIQLLCNRNNRIIGSLLTTSDEPKGAERGWPMREKICYTAKLRITSALIGLTESDRSWPTRAEGLLTGAQVLGCNGGH